LILKNTQKGFVGLELFAKLLKMCFYSKYQEKARYLKLIKTIFIEK